MNEKAKPLLFIQESKNNTGHGFFFWTQKCGEICILYTARILVCKRFFSQSQLLELAAQFCRGEKFSGNCIFIRFARAPVQTLPGARANR